MALDLAGIRSFVRTHLELDDAELTNVVLDRFIADASERIEAYSRTWSFRAVTYPFSTAIGIASYNVGGNVYERWTGISKTVLDVTDVRGPRHSLKPVDHRQARDLFSASTTQTGTPTMWSRFGEDLFLWPTPATVEVMTLSGYRAADDLIGAGSIPDLPNELHELLCWWALSRGYAQQDDTELADFYRTEFEAQLRRRASRYVAGNAAQPLQVGSGAAGSAGTFRYAGGPVLDWE